MIVKIGKNEIDAMQMVCALSEYDMTLYSIETNPGMVQVEILERNGKEISLTDAWFLGRTIAWRLMSEELKKEKL